VFCRVRSVGEHSSAPWAFVFPGQGSQRPGMLDAIPHVDGLDQLIDVACALSSLDLRSIAGIGSEGDLADTRVAQPLLYLTGWAWAIALKDNGVAAKAVAGHSLGEFVALTVAGAFSVEVGLELVVERSRLMASVAESSTGGMAAVLGLDGDIVTDALAGVDDAWIANDNCPGQVVISGRHEAIGHATHVLTETGAKRIVPLKVAGPFHSPIMAPAADAFADILRDTEISTPIVPVYQNAIAKPAPDAEGVRKALAAQITSPVRWTETMQAMVRDGFTKLIEVGSGSVLTGLARRTPDVIGVSVETQGLRAVIEEVV